MTGDRMAGVSGLRVGLTALITRMKADRAISNGVYALLLGFLPLAFGSLSGVWFYYGCLVFIYFLLTRHPHRGLPPGAGFAILVCLLMALSDLVSVLTSPNITAGLWLLPNSLQFLLVPLLLWGMWLGPRGDYLAQFVSGARASVLPALLFGLLQLAFFNFERVSALAGNAIPYADLAVLGGGWGLLFLERTGRRGHIFAGLTALLAIAIAILAQVRGALLAVPVIVAVLVIYGRATLGLSLRRLALLLSVFVVASAALAITPTFQSRIRAALAFAGYSEAQGQAGASEQHRWELWSAGLKTAQARPWFGVGLQNRVDAVRATARADGIELPAYTHLHNEYITTLVGKGVFGLVVLVLVLAAPVVTVLRSPRDSGFATRLSFAVMLSGCYAVFGLTNLAFGHDLMNTAFVAGLLMVTIASAQAHAGIAERQLVGLDGLPAVSG